MNGSIDMSTELLDTLKTMSERAPVGIRIYCETAAKKLEGSAKQRAPWTDRTGQARQRLTAFVTQIQPGICTITLAHGVDYGVYLELAHEKKYATIMPSIIREAPAIMSGFKVLIGG